MCTAKGGKVLSRGRATNGRGERERHPTGTEPDLYYARADVPTRLAPSVQVAMRWALVERGPPTRRRGSEWI